MTYSEQILQAIEEGKLEQLDKLINQAVVYDDKDYVVALYNELFYLGFLDEVKKIIHKLQKKDSDLQYNLMLAEIAIEDDNIDQALDYLEQIPKDSPYYVESLMITADIYQILGLPEVSLHKLEEALQLAPDEEVLQFAIAELQFASGEYEEASKIYEELLNNGQQNISDISINERLGISFSIMGHFEEAVPYLENSLKEHRGDNQLFYLGYTYLQIDETEKAIQLLEELLSLNDTYQSAYYYLAEAYKSENRLDQALETVTKGLKVDEYQSRLYQLAAEIVYLKHDVNAAENYLKQAIEYDQGETARQALATLYVTEEQFTEAIQTIEKMQEIDGMANWTLAQSYRALENDTKAMQFYQEAAEELNHQVDFMRDYGLYLREVGYLDESKTYLRHYLEHVPDDLEISDVLEQMEDNFNY